MPTSKDANRITDMNVHLIITCVAQKKVEESVSILDEKILPGNINYVFEQWERSLTKTKLKPVRASELYKGNLWDRYMDLWGLIQGRVRNSKLWILSAGHGFINGDEPIIPYNITFQEAKFDIPSLFTKVQGSKTNENKREISRQWWDLLKGKSKNSKISSISSLVHSCGPDDLFIIVAGRDYIDAVYNDLNAGIEKLKNRENLVLISNNVNDPLLKTLKPNWLYSDSRFVNLKKTNSTTVNASIAKQLFWEVFSSDRGLACWSIKEFNNTLRNIAEDLEEVKIYDREKGSDEEIKAYILSHIRNKAVPFSKLHRTYRNLGKACEYKRFRELYKEVKIVIEEETKKTRKYPKVTYSKRKAKMLFFLPDWDDRVDPDFNFEEETSLPFRNPYEHDKYHYELYGHLNCDGILVSKSVLEGNINKKNLVRSIGIHKYLRLPSNVPVLGDCGAFNYIMAHKPPYKTKETLQYYEELGFDYGVSIDHLIVPAVYTKTRYNKLNGTEWQLIEKDEYKILSEQSDSRIVKSSNASKQLKLFRDEILLYQEDYIDEKEKLRRYKLTFENAIQFIEGHKKAGYNFIPIGATQGWSPESYAEMVWEYEKMGYRYIAIGGMIKSKTEEITAVLEEVNKRRKKDTKIHIFGVARTDAIETFKKLGVTSVDSTGVLRQAWLSSTNNYYAPDFNNYSAIRIPQASESKIEKMKAEGFGKSGTIGSEFIKGLEKNALDALRLYDRGEIGLKQVLKKVSEYNQIMGIPYKLIAHYQRTLEDRPWQKCQCKICQETGIDVVIFRGNNRNRRRGFHNTWVYYNWFKEKTKLT